MSNPLIRECENYVILEPSQPEKLLSAADTLAWLESWLEKLDELPYDLKNQSSLSDAADRLLHTACALEVEPGFNLQWFAVRLDPHGDL